MKLNKGQKAIDFTVRDIDDRTIRLSDFQGGKVLLAFFRNVHCPFCNVRIHHLSLNKASFEEKGLKMIFFFESPKELITESLFHRHVQPIPLIADPEKKIYRQYGVEASTFKMLGTFLSSGNSDIKKQNKTFDLPEDTSTKATQNLIPADFLIDEQLIIQKAHYGANLKDHISINEINQFIQS